MIRVAPVLPVSASPRLAARLRLARGPAIVLHRGTDAIYLEIGDGCVGVVSTRAVAVPCALRTALDRLPEVRAAAVVGGVLHLDGTPLTIGRLVNVSVPPLRAVPSLAALVTIGEPNPDIEVEELLGRGDGLTPYGDDVLCGWLATHRAAGVATPEVDARIRARAAATTRFSATLLECAMHGEVIPQFAAWLAAVGRPEEERRAQELAQVGHSSGRGLMEGARRALRTWEGVAA